MAGTGLGLRRLKVVALAVADPERARRFYAETLSLPPALEGGEQAGYRVGDIVLMLKADAGPPGAASYPRLTLEVDDAHATARALGERGVALPDPVRLYEDGYLVGSFLDSEGNRLWFCSASAG